AHAWKGWTLHQAGRHEEALSSLVRARRLAWASAWLGKTLTALGRPKEAVRALTAALKADPSYAPAWGWRGEARRRLGSLRAAVVKAVLVHRHAFIPSVARTLEIGRTADLPPSFDEAFEADVAAAVRALWAKPGAAARRDPLEALVDRYAAPAGMRALERSGAPLWLALAQMRRVDLPAAWKTLDALCAARPDWSWPLLVRSELGRVDIVFDKAL